MGTVVNMSIYTSGENVAPEIDSLLANIENKYLSRKVESSELSAVNKGAEAGRPVEVSAEMRGYIEGALAISKKSGGAFDITVGDVSDLWDFDSEGASVPDAGKIRSLLERVGHENVRLSGSAVEVAEGASLDLGGIGKGIGCDELEGYFKGREEITGALVNIGGSSTVTYGQKGTGKPWRVAIQNPRESEQSPYLGVLEVDGVRHISTSGDYEKYFEADGKRYHHILDPATGFPAESGLVQTTVVMGGAGAGAGSASSVNDDGTGDGGTGGAGEGGGALSDALSTACFVLGKEAGMELLKAFGAEGIFVDEGRNVYVTDGLAGEFEMLASEYSLSQG
jgi:thiamine biosynthesis lipoprotein